MLGEVTVGAAVVAVASSTGVVVGVTAADSTWVWLCAVAGWAKFPPSTSEPSPRIKSPTKRIAPAADASRAAPPNKVKTTARTIDLGTRNVSLTPRVVLGYP